jgi:predicted regulator of Ras-like GTPase activity (Roadblock/LC7/MglB family)
VRASVGVELLHQVPSADSHLAEYLANGRSGRATGSFEVAVASDASMLWPTMDAQQALADLTEISSQIQAAVVFDDTGKVAAATIADSTRADDLARAAGGLLAAADAVKTGESALTQLEVATGEGNVFVVRDGKTVIAATTGSNPTAGLVFYDLKSALRNVKPKPVRKPAAPKKPAAAKKTTTAAKKKTASRKPVRREKPDAS